MIKQWPWLYFIFTFPAKGRARPTTSSETPQASKASAPCDNCGGLQLVTWKGGGYNMTAWVFYYFLNWRCLKCIIFYFHFIIVNKRSRSSPSKSEASSTGRNLEDSYVSGLLQQIKLLELEINYMKQHTVSPYFKINWNFRRKSNQTTKWKSVQSLIIWTEFNWFLLLLYYF